MNPMPAGHFVVARFADDRERSVQLQHLAFPHVISGGSDNGTGYVVFVIPRTRPDALAKAQALIGASGQLDAVALSTPMEAVELDAVRKAWGKVGWDLSAATDEELERYLGTRSAGKFDYCLLIAFDPSSRTHKPRVIRTVDHPEYKPERMALSGDEIDIEHILAGEEFSIEVRDVTVTQMRDPDENEEDLELP